MVFQMHKWLYGMPVPNNEREFAEVGEWIVAERVPVYRGEYLGHDQRVEVPVWKPTQEAFVLMADKYSNRYPGVAVNFSQPDGSDLILVDFDGGEASYKPANGKADITQKCATEAIVMAPDGRLLVHDSVTDRNDTTREERLKAYHDRIKEVKAGKNNKPDTSPLGGGGGGQ